jgi:hypothetical protein
MPVSLTSKRSMASVARRSIHLHAECDFALLRELNCVPTRLMRICRRRAESL